MGTAIKHFLLGGAIGLLLAAAGAVVLLALRISIEEQLPVLVPVLGLSVISAAATGAIVSLLQRRSKNTARPLGPGPIVEDAEPALGVVPPRVEEPRKRRRHPLDGDPCMARISPSLRWQTVSKALARLLRGLPDHLVGKPVFSLLHPEDVSAVDQAFTQAKGVRAVQHVLCRFLVADQPPPRKRPRKKSLHSDTKLLPPLTATSFVYVRLDIWAKLDRTGKVGRFVCRCVDLTPIILAKELEMHTARKELRSVKRRMHRVDDDLSRLKLSYRELYQNAPVMYFSLDQAGQLVTFNDTLLHTLGYERLELQGKNYTQLLAPSALKTYASIARGTRGPVRELELKWRKKDGAELDVWLHSVPVFDERGQFVRHRSAALEMTEKNRLSDELRARGDELERTNQRLRTINSELEAFTHVVSHDLKEPLRTLQAYSHLLAEDHGAQLGPDAFQYINHLIRASRRLGALIDELLNLSQAGRITRAPEAFNLIEIVATVRQDLVDLIQRKQAILLTEGSLSDVTGDPVRLTQLLSNLVANGLKYNQHSAPQIVITAVPCADDPMRVTVSVRDNGIGIDPAFHQQIFGIFRRLHQGDEYEGTGAGLAICKKIVEGHGGAIWVESQPGQGATFFFTLPRAPANKVESTGNGKLQPPEPKSGVQKKPQRRSSLHKDASNGQATAHIILVEDQSDVGMIIQKLGKRDGLDVTWFPTAEEAWSHLQEHEADLLLLDVNLPGISGIELCRRIRTLAHHKDTPVAMFTPDQEPEQLDELRTVGADFFLTKDLLCEPAGWRQKMLELIEQIRQPAPH